MREAGLISAEVRKERKLTEKVHVIVVSERDVIEIDLASRAST